MTKIEKTGAAPVSKYAAKKAARAKANAEEAANAKLNNEVEETTGAQQAGEVAGEVANSPKPAVLDLTPTPAKPQQKAKKDKKKELPPITGHYPDHVVQIALLIKNNAEIRRFTALGILNYLLQKGEIKGNARYVSFKWNKFAVKCNGLMREYSYNEPFFLNALVASFASFSASAQRTIDHFCKQEMSVGISKAVDQEEVENIAVLNEQYQGIGNEVSDDTASIAD